MSLLRDQASQPLRDLLEAVARGRLIVNGLRCEDRLSMVWRDIEDAARDLEKAADRAHGLGIAQDVE